MNLVGEYVGMTVKKLCEGKYSSRDLVVSFSRVQSACVVERYSLSQYQSLFLGLFKTRCVQTTHHRFMSYDKISKSVYCTLNVNNRNCT